MPEQNVEVHPPPISDPHPENGSAAIEVKPRSDMAGLAKSNGSAPVEANYQYWREHGGEWADNYDQRKKNQILYHIQELMLTQYMLQHAATAAERPMKVLEFGCGVGRHLRNLTRLPNVDAYGYDQSQAMAGSILRWAGKAWFDSHISVGMPTGQLPYADQSFDIVYTAEVLVHVRPEHLDGILAELVRVCRGHILHMETSEHYALVSDSHDGCWRHDLVAAYARLGLDCQVLPSGYVAHTPYRVSVHQEPRFTWAPAIVEMYRRMEKDINGGFEGAAIAAYNSQLQLQQQHAQAQQQLQQQTQLQHEAAQAQLGQLQRQVVGLSASLDQRSVELEGARTRIAALEEQGAAQGARAEALAGELESLRAREQSLRTHASELERIVADLRREIGALTTRAAELEHLGAIDRAAAQTLAQERRSFVDAVSKHLRP